ncbi:MAG: B12-binding domain-containing radical SAM protein [Methanobacterium sp.]|nr:B12-binding domain-containing radical SAM protein [Methanobacterium sp.]
MKVLMINPPYSSSKYRFIGLVAPPLGIAYIAAVLEADGVEVKIIDAPALELDYETIQKEVINFSPDIVAITSVTPTLNSALKVAQMSKEAHPGCLIILGGYHPTFTYQELLKNDFIDLIVRGEGEYTMLELVQSLQKREDLKRVKGIATKDFITPPRPVIDDLDSIPFPARHLLPMKDYKIMNMKLPVGTLISGRGCPYQCSFCASSAMHGQKLRLRSSGSVVDEMEHLVNDHKAEMLAFMDDTFCLNKKRINQICDEIKERKFDNYWGCTARVDTISEELLKKMKDAGCITLFLGVESADQQSLNELNKNITISKIKKTFELTKKLGVRTIASVVLGMPGDTRKSIENTIRFVKKLEPNYAVFSLATPYPGTDFYMKSKDDRLIKTTDWSKFNLLSPVIETVDCSLDELKKLQKRAFKEFYARPIYLLKQSWMDGPIIFKTALTILKEI